MCSALPGFHSLSRCDSTCAFAGMGKDKFWELLKKYECHREGLSCLGEDVELSEDVLRSCKSSTYSSKHATGAGDENAVHSLLPKAETERELTSDVCQS